jgi:hypothetical protein
VIETELPAGNVQPVLPDTEPGHAAGQIVSRVRLTNVIVRSPASAGRDIDPRATAAVAFASRPPEAGTASPSPAASQTTIRKLRRIVATSPTLHVPSPGTPPPPTTCSIPAVAIGVLLLVLRGPILLAAKFLGSWPSSRSISR